MDWKSIFEVCYTKRPGLREDQLEEFLSRWHAPLTELEISEYGPADSKLWRIPAKPLPASYTSFLRFSDGGEFANGERYFQFFGSAEIRSMLLAYEFPQYMPGAVPFAMDGNGNHYVWDMRADPHDQEYPILIASSGNLGFADTVTIAQTFAELCRGTTAAEDLLFG
ncbi:SMI1/KNR4 family protein [Paenibacillus sanfengchensis]|uniref:SMI1/KNR4 family protein n=1 Tax=Paenibacillus sanfengchensis TaxID=3119819 RepID=UPI002FE3581A